MPRLVEVQEQLSALWAAVCLLPCCPKCCSDISSSKHEGIVLCSVPGSLIWLQSSSSWELCDGPEAAWMVGPDLMFSHSWGLWDGPRPSWLAVLGLASYELALEAVRGGRKVSSMKP